MKPKFASGKLIYSYLGEMIRRFAGENNIHYREIIASTHMSNSTYRRVLQGKDMHLNCYLRIFCYFSWYFDNPKLFLDFLIGFIEEGLRDICRMAGIECENWCGECE